MANDPGRALLVAQWREELNLSWPPERRRRFAYARLAAVAGWKVSARQLADRWATPVQDRLRLLGHVPEQKREKALTAWLDEQLRNDPDSQTLVKGGDLVELGIPPAERTAVLEELQRLQLEGLTREDLLEQVTQRTGG